MRRPQSNELRPQTALMRRFPPILSLAWLAQLHAFVPVCPVRFKVYNRALPAIHDGTRNTWSDLTSETNGVDEDVTLESSLTLDSVSSLFDSRLRWNALLESIQSTTRSNLLWEQAKEEAQHALTVEPDAGAQLYQGILFHKSLLEAIVTNISHEIETELMPATAIKNLFLDALTPDDEKAIERDIMAVAMRSPSAGNIMTTILFHKGFHALVCYRVGHRLWEAVGCYSLGRVPCFTLTTAAQMVTNLQTMRAFKIIIFAAVCATVSATKDEVINLRRSVYTVPNEQQLQEPTRRVFVKYRRNRRSAFQAELQQRSSQTRVHYDFKGLDTFVMTLPESEVESLKANPDVVVVRDDVPRYPQYIPESAKRHRLQTDEEVTPYGIDMVQAREVWKIGARGQNVTVCVVDTGVYGTHEDLPRVSGLDSSEMPWDDDGVGHGTHCAGIIAAEEGNGKGVVGVAPDANIFSVKVFTDSGVCVFLWYSRCGSTMRIQWR
ncbi:serine O-acetyltransferase [Fragilaria crotonensis]|nr:serine O-acetyltransferase [Fragilaria crotonensis]